MKSKSFIIKSVILAFLVSLTGCQMLKKVEKNENEITTDEVKLEYKFAAQLGEGALWNVATQELYWVDIIGQNFHRYNPKTRINKSYELPSQVGTVVSYDENQVVVALEDRVSYLNLNNHTLTDIAAIPREEKGSRLNDGKVDPNGNLWVGSMSKGGENPTAQLYRVDSQGEVKVMLKDVRISNGIVWSKDAQTMFYIDTKKGNIRAYDYDKTTSEISNERVIVTIPESLGFPDGMAIDDNDNLWVGLWNGNGIAHYNSKTGELISKIEVPAHNVTSCAFGGSDLKTLYITTASVDMTAEEKIEYPLAGSVFSVRTNVKGVESPLFLK
ncbi:MAG: SMP-30/gluconolactonase/LRE family protein [Nonlabens sp.]|uniref:SMP-30/gluconolactonase/LRE family protein n=1 Tax=Nonlabens sp. TaxID=1888209 RepID=UPI003EF829BD